MKKFFIKTIATITSLLYFTSSSFIVHAYTMNIVSMEKQEGSGNITNDFSHNQKNNRNKDNDTKQKENNKNNCGGEDSKENNNTDCINSCIGDDSYSFSNNYKIKDISIYKNICISFWKSKNIPIESLYKYSFFINGPPNKFLTFTPYLGYIGKNTILII